MTKEELLKKIKNQAYCSPKRTESIPPQLPVGHTFDENLTVKANRLLWLEYEDKRQAAISDWHKTANAIAKQFHEDLQTMLTENYAVNTAQAQKIAGEAYEEDHAYGYEEVVQTACDIADLYIELKNLEGT